MPLQTAEISRQTHPLRFSAPFSDGSAFYSIHKFKPNFLDIYSVFKEYVPESERILK